MTIILSPTAPSSGSRYKIGCWPFPTSFYACDHRDMAGCALPSLALCGCGIVRCIAPLLVVSHASDTSRFLRACVLRTVITHTALAQHAPDHLVQGASYRILGLMSGDCLQTPTTCPFVSRSSDPQDSRYVMPILAPVVRYTSRPDGMW